MTPPADLVNQHPKKEIVARDLRYFRRTNELRPGLGGLGGPWPQAVEGAPAITSARQTGSIQRLPLT